MDYWEGIVACGLVDHPVVALEQILDPLPSIEHIRREVVFAFGEVFEMRMVEARLPASLELVES
jgi:lipoate-protein ligase B